jgi:hypothetical protein
MIKAIEKMNTNAKGRKENLQVCYKPFPKNLYAQTVHNHPPYSFDATLSQQLKWHYTVT